MLIARGAKLPETMPVAGQRVREVLIKHGVPEATDDEDPAGDGNP